MFVPPSIVTKSLRAAAIFSTAGDSVVAEFASAVEALRCAISIQDELRARNSELLENRRMHLRIGLNVGDVLVHGSHLYGDGVNVAARLESLAEPGGICVSGSVFSLVKNKLSFRFVDIGPQRVKNIPEPVPAFKLRVAIDEPTADATKQASAKLFGRKPVWWLAMVAAGAVVAGGIAFWIGRPGLETQPSMAMGKSPLSVAALQQSRQYVGMTVNGTSRVTGRPFIMRLEKEGKVEVEIELASGQKRGDDGTRWIDEKGRFCVHFAVFAGGNQVCRRMVQEPSGIVAYTWDGQTDGWAFRK